MKNFFIHHKKSLTITTCIIVFLFTFIRSIPSTVLSKLINNYSRGYLALYNPSGTFWHGNGLLAVSNPRTHDLSPLLLINWQVKLGYPKFVDIMFNVDNSPIGELYLDKTGANLNKLNLSLSITQVSQMIDIINTMSLSGNLVVRASHITVGKKISGKLNIDINQVSSNIAPVNPLGTYHMNFNLSNGGIEISSNPGANLEVNGRGNLAGLILQCRAKPEKKDKMLEFLTVMGQPQPDGSYAMKVF